MLGLDWDWTDWTSSIGTNIMQASVYDDTSCRVYYDDSSCRMMYYTDSS